MDKPDGTRVIRLIADAFRDGQVVPFLGAGVNFAQRAEGSAAWTEGATFLPGGSELAEWLGGKVGIESTAHNSNLALMSWYVRASAGRKRLNRYLRSAIEKRGTPTRLHHLLAKRAAERPMLIITTNYDSLIEDALNAGGNKDYLVVSHAPRDGSAANTVWIRKTDNSRIETAVDELSLDLTKQTVVYKMHGSIDRPSSCVVTEEDYIKFFLTMPSFTIIPPVLYSHARRKNILFLGYGLGDWNTRVLLARLSLARGGPVERDEGGDDDAQTNDATAGDDADEDDADVKHWAVMRDVAPLDQTIWATRDVNLQEIDIRRFTDSLWAELWPGEAPP